MHFGWGDKIAPRLGGAYDVLHNGKLKVYASYGQFYDIMKLGLARGSFGSDYWHNCVYAMDDADYTKITPTYPIGGGCPASGPAPGVTIGRFIENVDFRATKADTRDPAISPTMKPMKQHEFVTGADWAVNPNWAFTFRYSRKRLDNTIEDMSITDNLGFYIGNPGTQFADVLHRPVGHARTPDGNNYLTSVPFCAECPPVVKAIRRYDGAEFRLAKRPGAGKWFGSVSYTYSKLTRQLPRPDQHRPDRWHLRPPCAQQQPSVRPADHDLSSERQDRRRSAVHRPSAHRHRLRLLPPAVEGHGDQPRLHPVRVPGHADQYLPARGGHFVGLPVGRRPRQFREAGPQRQWQHLVQGDVVKDARTDPLIQTDFNLRHEIVVEENARMAFEATFINLFNQRAVESVYQFVIPTNLISPTRASRFSGDPRRGLGQGHERLQLHRCAERHGRLCRRASSKLTLASRYGMPNLFQTGPQPPSGGSLYLLINHSCKSQGAGKPAPFSSPRLLPPPA